MNFLKNYFSSLGLIVCAYFLYTQSSFHPGHISGSVSIDVLNIQFQMVWIFYGLALSYIILLIPHYYFYTDPTKARLTLRYFGKIMSGRGVLEATEKNAFLAIIVKLFFIPLMLVWLVRHIENMINNLANSFGNIDVLSRDFLLFFNEHFFWTAFSLILFIDVLFFTLGYIIESPYFKNTIKSVQPTLLGWAVVILCYPPFNDMTSNFVSWYSTDFPNFANTYVHIVMNICILILMGIYASASWSLGLKASNLTNRGIVRSGVYAYVRHPAYICKNLAWLIGGMPMIYVAYISPDLSLIGVLFGLGTWTFIYYLRAMTEEYHLSLDPDYIAYKKQVPYKFIPKIW